MLQPKNKLFIQKFYLNTKLHILGHVQGIRQQMRKIRKSILSKNLSLTLLVFHLDK